MAPLSERTHFWIRFIGLTLILAAEFAPRLWGGVTASPTTPVAAVVDAR